MRFLHSHRSPALLSVALLLGTCSGFSSTAVKPLKTKSTKAVTRSLTTSRKTVALSAKSATGKKFVGKRTSRAESRATAAVRAAATERVVRLNSAFVATSQLRPMAQQLASTRSAASFAGISSYALGHPGVGAATAYLALGHAYALDHRYSDAVDAYKRAGGTGDALSDYSDFLGAQALIGAGRSAEATPLLDHFSDRHPDSVFEVSAPLLLANALVQQRDGAGAVKALEPMLGTPEADHSDFKLALARAYQASGENGKASALFRSIYVNQPLSYEAGQAQVQLSAMGTPPSAAERKLHADQLFNAKRYNDALNEYNAVRNDTSLTEGDRDGLALYTAVCDLKLKRLSRHDAEKLPTTGDDTAALKMYLLAEISRTEKDRSGHDALIADMLNRYPQSRWLEEALYSGGNMYLLTHDTDQAIYHYKLLVEHFPNSVYAPSAHWRVAWMYYRLRRYTDSAKWMDEQIVRYPAGVEASSALYWRGRILEDEEHDLGQAANYYRALNANYTNFYYGDLARQRLAIISAQAAGVAPTPVLASVRKLNAPELIDAVPQSDPHVIKAKLLANAALNEYIGPEIALGAGAAQWGALAQAQIYASYGEYTRALQSMKHSGISFFSIPAKEVPTDYWKLMFPQPYWGDLMSDAERNGVDPYLVASLIRQESEFNPGAVSPAHAYGLMQLLPSVGKENAKREGIKGFQAGELLNPSMNLQLGTRNLRQVLDRFGGQPEYALAAYNAGDVPVRQWMAAGEYKDLPEFVESIPYTETREYVQAILRNREMYRMLYAPQVNRVQ